MSSLTPDLFATLPQTVRPPVVIHCPREACAFAASALSEGRALRAIAQHIVRAHWPTERSSDERRDV